MIGHRGRWTGTAGRWERDGWLLERFRQEWGQVWFVRKEGTPPHEHQRVGSTFAEAIRNADKYIDGLPVTP